MDQSHRTFRIRGNHWRLSNLTPLLSAGLPTADCPGLYSVWFCISPQMEIPQYLCAGIAPFSLCCIPVLRMQGWSQQLWCGAAVMHWKHFLCLLAWLCLVLPECFKGAVTQFWFLVHQDPPALLCRAAFLPFAPHSLCWCMGLFLSKYMALNMISLNFVRFLFVYFSRLLQSLGMAAKQHSHLVYQPLLPNICHLRACCWHALFHLSVH